MVELVVGGAARVQLIDLVALISLERLTWIEEGRAREVFADRAPVLETVVEEAHRWVLGRARTYMSPDEVAHQGTERVVQEAWNQILLASLAGAGLIVPYLVLRRELLGPGVHRRGQPGTESLG